MNERAPLGVAVIGGGGFTTTMYLPNLARLADYRVLAAVHSDEGRARKVGEEYEQGYATSDYRRVLPYPAVDLVVITTPHDQHGRWRSMQRGQGNISCRKSRWA